MLLSSAAWVRFQRIAQAIEQFQMTILLLARFQYAASKSSETFTSHGFAARSLIFNVGYLI